MTATVSFRRWEMDPFFAAAEDVQDSADRLESAYRTWTHIKATPDDLEAASSIDFRRRELTTALGTAKWQLEEFERAVTEDEVYVGEDAPARHKQFVEAIRNQISLIEKSLLDSEDKPHLRALPMVNLGDDNGDDLAMFLSGTRSLNSNDFCDLQTTFVERDQAKNESPSNESGSRKSRGHSSSKHVLPASTLEMISKRAETGNADDFSSFRIQTHELRNQGSNSKGHDTQGKIANEVLDIRFEQRHSVISDESADKLGMESRIYDDDGCRGITVERMSGQQICTSIGSSLNSWKLGSVAKSAAADKLSESGRTGSTLNTFSFWAFFSGKPCVDKFKVSKSGFKRWKDGEANFKDEREMSTYLHLNGGTSDLELGASNHWPGGNMKVLNGYAYGVTMNGEEKQLNGWGETLQRQLQRTQAAFPSSRPAQIASAILVALGLLGVLSFHASASSL